MDNSFLAKPITGTGTIPAVSGEGIRLYDADGNSYYDLNEISNVLGQKNAHFTKRMTEKLNHQVGGKIADSPEKTKFYPYYVLLPSTVIRSLQGEKRPWRKSI